MKEITSLGNAVVKDVCNLKQKKYRERSGSFVVEGLRAVEEAVRYAAVQKIFAVPDAANTRLARLLADAAAKNVELYSVTEQVMKKMSDTEAPQGVLAVCSKPQGFIVADGTVLVLDRVADPGNVGTLIRTAEAAGIADEKIILDPGVGFGKTYENNLEIINCLEELNMFGYPLLLGCSRKSVIGLTLDLPVTERVEGTLVTTMFGVQKGCMFVRVHDVKENVRTIKMCEAILNSGK